MANREAQAQKKRTAELKVKQSWISSPANTSGITTANQALAWAKKPENKSLVGMDQLIAQLESDVKFVNMGYTGGNWPLYVKEGIHNIAQAKIDPTSFVKKNLPGAIFKARYGDKVALSQISPSISVLVSNKVPATEIQVLIAQGEKMKPPVQPKPSFMDQLFNVTDALIVGALTGGLGLSPLNAAALNTAFAVANGADVTQALQAGLAGLGAGQVGEYLQTVNAISGNQIVNSAVTNASRQAAAAAIMGQDVKTAALAGLAGGAVGGSLLRSTDNAAISRAAGEYTQAMASGMSPAAAMVQALSGFAEEEMVDAKTKIEQESAMQQAATRAPTVTPEDQIVEAFSQPRTPGVGTQIGQPTAELSGGIQFGSRADAVGTDIVPDDRLPSTPAKPVTVDSNTLPEVVVTPEPEGATEQPKRYDVRTGKLITTRIPTTTTTQNQPTPMPPPEKLTGAELIEQAQSPQDTSTLPEVTVEAEAGGEGKEPVTTRLPTAKGEGEGEATVPEVAPEEVTDDEILAAIDESRDPLILSLLGGRTSISSPPPSSVSSRAVGTSPTAAIVGQKEPVFGGEEDTQQDVWNTRSLRLRKALG